MWKLCDCSAPLTSIGLACWQVSSGSYSSRQGVGVGVFVGVAVLVGIEVEVGVCVGVGVKIGVSVGVEEEVGVFVGVEVGVGVFVGVEVLVGVLVEVGVLVGIGVFVGVASVSWMVHQPCGHCGASAYRVATPGTPSR
jgi:hypothetical protein